MKLHTFSALLVLIFSLLLIGTVVAKPSAHNNLESTQLLQTTTGSTTRVSVASDGTQGNSGSASGVHAVSADGHYVVFESDAKNLIPDDTNNRNDVFVYNTQTGQITRVSVASDGVQGNGNAGTPAISANGRYVAFQSYASNLVSNDTNGYGDIFVHDTQTGQTIRVSVASNGMQGNDNSPGPYSVNYSTPALSADGRYVVFESDASNLVSGDINNTRDVFVHDTQTGQTTRVSVASDGSQGNASSNWPDISDDGRYVAFQSFADNLILDDTNSSIDIFVHDIQTGQTTRVSVESDGTQWSSPSYYPTTSADGRYIAFQSYAHGPNIFVHDTQTGQTSDFSAGGNGEEYLISISADGRYVAFSSGSNNFVPGDTNGVYDIFVYDILSGQTIRVSVASDGTQGNYNSLWPAISDDGRYIVFSSLSSSLVSNDTNGKQDIFIHDRGEQYELSFNGVITSVWPTTYTSPNFVMQGGTVYRYLRLFDDGNMPLSNATMTFSVGSAAISDVQGYITYTISAESLGLPGTTRSVSIQSVSYNGQTYTTNNQPSFSVNVTPREYAHIWEYGAVRKGEAGVSGGLIAYLTGNVNGGLGLTLQESNPATTSDDIVSMNQSYTGEVGAGFGAGFAPSIEGGLISVSGPGGQVVGELLLRKEAEARNTFYNPYAESDRQKQGIMLLSGAADSLSGFPGQALLAAILNQAQIALPYDEVTAAQGIHKNIDISAELFEIGLLVGKNEGTEIDSNLIDVTLLSASGDMLVVTGNRYYDSQKSQFYLLDLQWQTNALSNEIIGIKNQVGAYIGQVVQSVQEEVFYDLNTGQIDRIELTVTGQGNDLTITDIDQNKVTIHYIILGDQITPAVLNSANNLRNLIVGVGTGETTNLNMGEDPIVAEIDALLGNVDYAEYVITTEDGAQLNLVPEIGIDLGIKISLGAGLELKQARQLVREQGVVLNGQLYPSATYQSDSYVAQPGKGWLELSTNAVGGLWDLVKAGFNWIWQQVTSGSSWVLGILSQTSSGTVLGGAQVDVPTGTQLTVLDVQPASTTIDTSSPITVTAASWVPIDSSVNNNVVTNNALKTASGNGFVIGGIYEFQPYEMTFSPSATLVVSYTQSAIGGVDEAQLSLFRWNSSESNWQPLPAQLDINANRFTVDIDQLGTFAIGYDDTLPDIQILAPINGVMINNRYPLLLSLVVDNGVGIDPATVKMYLDGQEVTATYISSTGELLYLQGQPLENGSHTLMVSASDAVGNASSSSVVFTVETEEHIYLPLILR